MILSNPQKFLSNFWGLLCIDITTEILSAVEVGFYLLLDFFRFLFDILAECLVFVCLELGDDAVDHGW